MPLKQNTSYQHHTTTPPLNNRAHPHINRSFPHTQPVKLILTFEEKSQRGRKGLKRQKGQSVPFDPFDAFDAFDN